MVFREKTEHPRHRVHGQTQAPPQGGHLGNGAFNQLSEGLLKDSHSRGQGTPRSLEATRLHDAGRWVQTLRLDPRPLVEVPLQSFRSNRPIRQPMRLQHRNRQPARRAEISEHLLLLAALRIRVALVMSVTMDRPRTTARTDGPRSHELIFANLNAEQNPDPSRPIKPRSFRIHEPSSLLQSANDPVSRLHRTSQRYNIRRTAEILSQAEFKQDSHGLGDTRCRFTHRLVLRTLYRVLSFESAPKGCRPVRSS